MEAGLPRSRLSALRSREAQIKASRDFCAPVSAVAAAAPNAIRGSRAEIGLRHKAGFHFAPVLGSLVQHWPPERRAWAWGLATAVGRRPLAPGAASCACTSPGAGKARGTSCRFRSLFIAPGARSPNFQTLQTGGRPHPPCGVGCSLPS